MFRTPSISFLIRTAAVLKGSTTSGSAAALASAAVFLPLALAVTIVRAIVAAGAFVVGHCRCMWVFDSRLQGARRANMGWKKMCE
jgi:hypothetical protein